MDGSCISYSRSLSPAALKILAVLRAQGHCAGKTSHNLVYSHRQSQLTFWSPPSKCRWTDLHRVLRNSLLGMFQVQAKGIFSVNSFYFCLFFGYIYSRQLFWQPGGAVVSKQVERESRRAERYRPVRQNNQVSMHKYFLSSCVGFYSHWFVNIDCICCWRDHIKLFRAT